MLGVPIQRSKANAQDINNKLLKTTKSFRGGPMYQKFNTYSFYLSLLSLLLFSYFIYICIGQTFIISTFSLLLLFLLTMIALVFGGLGFNYRGTVLSKIRSWLTLFFVIILSLTWLFLLLTTYIGGKQLLKTVHSPNDYYTISFYSWDAGAAGTFGIVGEIDGVWFNKRFYREKRIEQVEVYWINNSIISINGHELNLDNKEVFYR